MPYRVYWSGKTCQGVFQSDTAADATMRVHEATGLGADSISIHLGGKIISVEDLAARAIAEASRAAQPA